MAYRFHALAAEIELACDDMELMQLIRRIWPADTPKPARPAQTQHYRVAVCESGYTFCGKSGQSSRVRSRAELLHLLDKSILIALQQDNPDLLFMHGATLHHNGGSVMLTGSSGAGKSSLALALSTRSCWSLMSDELAPINLDLALVYPYRRAIGLKTAPPDGVTLPVGSLRVDPGLHVPADELPAQACPAESPLRAIIAVNGQAAEHYSNGARMSQADSALVILRNSLNSLAHSGNALPAAIELAGRVPCYNLPRQAMASALACIESIWNEACIHDRCSQS